MRLLLLASILNIIACGQMINIGGTSGTTPWTACASGCDGAITASPMTIEAGSAKSTTTHGHGIAPILACYDSATPRAVIAPGSTNCNYTIATDGKVVLTYSVAPGLLIIYGGGTQGQQGTAGTNGTNGRTLLSGTAIPTTEGSDGDFYFRTSTSCLYGPKATTWPACVNLVGPQGPAGEPGTNSVTAGDGILASTVLGVTTVSIDAATVVQYATGSGAPTSSGADSGYCKIGAGTHEYPVGQVTYTDTDSGTPYSCVATDTWQRRVRYVASGSLALATSAISSGACQTVTAGSVNSASATGVATTDVITFAANASIKAVTGYVPATAGGLSITAYPTSGYVNFDVCNWSASSITPGAVTVNWMVMR